MRWVYAPLLVVYTFHKLAFVIVANDLYKLVLMNENSICKNMTDFTMMSDNDDTDVGLATKPKTKTEKPKMYKVLLLNDDFTPMEFVVHVLERYFGIGSEQAYGLMMQVHQKGMAIVGVFSHDVAETKVMQVMELAKKHQHPLQCTMEKE